MNFFPGQTSAACYIYPKFSVLELGRIYVFASWKGATIGYPTLYYTYPLLSVTENVFYR